MFEIQNQAGACLPIELVGKFPTSSFPTSATSHVHANELVKTRRHELGRAEVGRRRRRRRGRIRPPAAPKRAQRRVRPFRLDARFATLLANEANICRRMRAAYCHAPGAADRRRSKAVPAGSAFGKTNVTGRAELSQTPTRAGWLVQAAGGGQQANCGSAGVE